jgi:hypothetical protein
MPGQQQLWRNQQKQQLPSCNMRAAAETQQLRGVTMICAARVLCAVG